MVSRVMLLFRLGIALGLVVFLEQPASSLMQQYFRFQELPLSYLYGLVVHVCVPAYSHLPPPLTTKK